MRSLRSLPAVVTAVLFASLPAARAQSAADAVLDDHRELGLGLARIAAEHPELATVVPVGTSRAGRVIEALRLAAGTRAPGRPAILVVANLDGPYVYTSAIALSEAERLAAGYANDARIRALLDSVTLYVVPRANPDAAEARFVHPLVEVRASGPGVDDDRDGRSGEDPQADVDEDGLVTQLRVRDPEGEWRPDPTDARVLVRADPKLGERGVYKLWPEGRDSDRDEKVAEDSELDVVVNQNFPQGWQAHEPFAGAFPTDEPEARALCEFILAHKDVALVVVYGALDVLVEKPKTAKDDAPRQKLLPAEGLLESDAELLAEIGKRYRKATGNESKGEGDDRGTFQAWCQTQRGLWCLSIRPWSIPLDGPAKKDAIEDAASGVDEAAQGADDADKEKPAADAPETAATTAADPDGAAAKAGAKKSKDDEAPTPSDDAKRLRWIDAEGESARFVPWKSFVHPELGEVEIGGLAPFATIEPPAAELERITTAELSFLLSLGELLPRVRVTECTAKDLFGGLWEIEAVVENDSFLPLASSSARRAEGVRPARVSLRLPPGAKLLAGNRQELVSDLRGSGGRKKLRWLVHGAAPTSIGVEVETDHAGLAQAIPEVVR